MSTLVTLSADTFPARVRPHAHWAVFLLGSLVALPFVLSLALGNSLSRDEHQHIAAGVLFTRDGLLPYRDFPFFHVPYLVYIYGLLFKITGHYVLASRVFSAICAALTCGAVACTAWRLFDGRTVAHRALISASALVLLVSTPLFYNTVGHSWNQEPSVLLAVLAFLCHHSAFHCERPSWRFLSSGLLIGFAIGTRITLAPLVLPFAVMIWLSSAPKQERLHQLLLFAVGIALALLPVAGAFLSAPEGFVFGNVEFPKVNITYRFATGEPRTMTLLKKLRFLVKEVMRPNWVLFYGFLGAWLTVWIRIPAPLSSKSRLFIFLLLTLPFLFLGALAPSPVFDQYFYPLVPVLVLATLCLFAIVPKNTLWLRWMWGAAVVLVLAAAAFGVRRYDNLADLFRPQKWYPFELALEAAELRRVIPTGKVLTLAPALPLEAGLQIYPQFATGPFAWRVAPFVPRERRTGLRLVAPEDLELLLAADPPAAVMTGFDKRWEKPIVQFAETRGYRRTSILNDKQLWIAPPGGLQRQPTVASESKP